MIRLLQGGNDPSGISNLSSFLTALRVKIYITDYIILCSGKFCPQHINKHKYEQFCRYNI